MVGKQLKAAKAAEAATVGPGQRLRDTRRTGGLPAGWTLPGARGWQAVAHEAGATP